MKSYTNMKKLFFILLAPLMVMVSFSAEAQTETKPAKATEIQGKKLNDNQLQKLNRHKNIQSPEQAAKRYAMNAQKRLGLTDEQTTKVEAERIIFANKMQELRKSAQGNDKMSYRDEMMVLVKDFETGLKDIFTAEQYEQFLKTMSRSARMERSGQRPATTAPLKGK